MVVSYPDPECQVEVLEVKIFKTPGGDIPLRGVPIVSLVDFSALPIGSQIGGARESFRIGDVVMAMGCERTGNCDPRFGWHVIFHRCGKLFSGTPGHFVIKPEWDRIVARFEEQRRPGIVARIRDWWSL